MPHYWRKKMKNLYNTRLEIQKDAETSHFDEMDGGILIQNSAKGGDLLYYFYLQREDGIWELKMTHLTDKIAGG